jgi:hypothetical protein
MAATGAVSFSSESDWICRSYTVWDGDVELVIWILPPLDFALTNPDWLGLIWASLEMAGMSHQLCS